MKSRITKKLAALNQQGGKAFVPFIMAGDPSLAMTEKLVYTLEKSGATLIELGVPFSDPMADGPVIQQAGERALKKKTTLKAILALVKRVRHKTQIPILLMGYYNPILQYGLQKFAEDAAQSGVDGALVVDLPIEESHELRTALKKKGLNLVFLLAPTSDDGRIQLAGRWGSGFVYYVSLTGVTGAQSLNTSNVGAQIQRLRRRVKQPILIGFGISKPEHVRKLSPLADGVVVGSALVDLIHRHARSKNLSFVIEKYVRDLIGH